MFTKDTIVELLPFEDEPSQWGHVIDYSDEIYTIRLQPQYRDGAGDSGLREVPIDQVVEPRFVAGTLDWCNDVRGRRGLEPLTQLPRGVRTNPESCPCGAATGLSVGGATWHVRNDKTVTGSCPPDVQDFVRCFDAGWLPHYDLHQPEVTG